jgi:5-methylcytosine-specific restriction endonuclease McrA
VEQLVNKAPSRRKYKGKGRRLRRRAWRLSAIEHCPFCDYCNAELTESTSTVDHINPSSAGGSDGYKNWALACQPCNARKGGKALCEVGMRLIARRALSGRRSRGYINPPRRVA